MSGQRAVDTTWPNLRAKGGSDGRAILSLDFKLGPYRLGRARFDLVIQDFGLATIIDQAIDVKSLPAEESLYLRSVPDQSGLALSPVFERMLVYPAYRYDRSWVVTEGCFERYLGSFSKTSRKGLRRRTRKLTERSGGRLDIKHYDQADDMAAFHRDARILSAKTFQERLMDEGIPADQSFLTAMIARASGGDCYGTILYLDEQPISFLYCERQGSGWLPVYGGFDPAYASYSPGSVHLLFELERSFEAPDCSFFDFGPGASDYKQFFSTHNVPSSDILILNKTVRNRLTIQMHKLLASMSETSRDLADYLKLQERIRQMIRGR